MTGPSGPRAGSRPSRSRHTHRPGGGTARGRCGTRPRFGRSHQKETGARCRPANRNRPGHQPSAASCRSSGTWGTEPSADWEASRRPGQRIRLVVTRGPLERPRVVDHHGMRDVRVEQRAGTVGIPGDGIGLTTAAVERPVTRGESGSAHLSRRLRNDVDDAVHGARAPHG